MRLIPLAAIVSLLSVSNQICIYSQANALDQHLTPVELKCEYLVNPMGIESEHPRLSWKVTSGARGQRQTAYRILVADSIENLNSGKGNVWDSGRVASGDTVNIPYGGTKLVSGQRLLWTVKSWDKDGVVSDWSLPGKWSMGLLKLTDWKADWISYRDNSPLHKDRSKLFLPPAHYFLKDFAAPKQIRRATVYASALGNFTLSINGKLADKALFQPGWSDYLKRACYRTYDVTGLLKRGDNSIGSCLTDGWYSGYVGYGLLVGYGPNKIGRYFYGKTPSLLVQLEIEYADGTKSLIKTDPSWKVSADGPLRESDLIMGEEYDARNADGNWANPSMPHKGIWEQAILSSENGHPKATFSDNRGNRVVDLGFQKPAKMQSYCAPPVMVVEEITPKSVKEIKPGVYIFDFGQNFAGTIRIRIPGPRGHKLIFRYGEMLHKDGSLMTENLRKARATDTYICSGSYIEEHEFRSTYHGFQYVEVTGLLSKPSPDRLRGLVIHSAVKDTGQFACSDPVMTRFWKNTVWTQRANFVELPTDCPQRDERLGWMGDAQVYARTATYNADCAAFYSKWLDDVEEAQLPGGAYPDYSPYPMGHGAPGQNFGTGWTDAGIICPWTVYKVYGDTTVIKRHWASMSRFMNWRRSVSKDNLGTELGNSWGDWLNAGETTSIKYIDTCYFAHDCKLMADMASAIGRKAEAVHYDNLRSQILTAYRNEYLMPDCSLRETSQTAYALALAMDLLPKDMAQKSAAILAEKVRSKGVKMTTGFLGTARILPALTAAGYHSLAVQLFQSREYPSWAYEVLNGATTVWERWDSYTKEHEFNGEHGGNNAAMNSFSHYSFGAVMEWGFQSLAGIETNGAGFKKIIIKPGVSTEQVVGKAKTIDWVDASYNSIHGLIGVKWKRVGNKLHCEIVVPANTTATVILPTQNSIAVTESGLQVKIGRGITAVRTEDFITSITIGSGRYIFDSVLPTASGG